MKKVMIFGVFDGLHGGHKALLKEAKKYGDYLIVVVAQNHIVEHLKGHAPKFDIAERMVHLQQEDGVDEVVIGDAKLGTWDIARQYRPDVIVFGYDQELLKEDFLQAMPSFDFLPELHVAADYEANMLHSKFLNR